MYVPNGCSKGTKRKKTRLYGLGPAYHNAAAGKVVNGIKAAIVIHVIQEDN